MSEKSENDDFQFIDEDSAKDKSKMAPESGDTSESSELRGAKTQRRKTDPTEQKLARRKRFRRRGLPILIVILCAAAVACFFGYRYYRSEQKEKAAIQKQQEKKQQKEDLLNQNLLVLSTNYLNAYAKGDTDSLSQYASPLTDAEKQWVAINAKYVDSFSDAKVERTDAKEKDTYFLFVRCNMKEEGSDTKVPWYVYELVTKTSDGTYQISNAYSAFNREFKLTETDDDLSKEFEAWIDSKEEEMQSIRDSASEVMKKDDALQKTNDARTAALEQWKTDTKNGTDLKAAEKKKAANKSKKLTKLTTRYPDGAIVWAKTEVRIRKLPSKKSKVLKVVPKHKKLYAYGRTANGWYKVRTHNTKGYIKGRYITSVK